MSRLFARTYGDGPRHLIGVTVAIVAAAYAWTQIFAQPQAWQVVLWFVGAIIAHDLVLLPLYTLLYAVAKRAGRSGHRPARDVTVLHHLVVPAAVSVLLLVVWLPEILRVSDVNFRALASLSSHAYLSRWLLITAGLFLASAIVYAARRSRSST